MKIRWCDWLMAALVLVAGGSCHSPVTIHPVRKELIETVYASGVITPVNEFHLSAQCTGTILKKWVKDGDTVRKGQLLYSVSAEDARERADAAAGNLAISEQNLSSGGPRLADLSLALQNAAVRLENDSLSYHRWKALWDQHIGTRNNLDLVYANYLVARNGKRIAEQQYLAAVAELAVARNNARSSLSTAKKQLQDYFIRSDRDGVVYQTLKEAGESVRPSDVVALIGDAGAPEVRLAVDQQDIARINSGQEVLVQADAAGSRVYRARVIRVYPVMNQLDQTFRVDARFDREAAPAFIHSSTEANIVIRKKAAVLVLPRSVLLTGDSVVVRENGKLRRIPVRTGAGTLDDIEIESGIDERAAIAPPDKTDQP